MTEDKIICPVMKSPVDTAQAVEAGLTGEYQGKVFYFCCPGCKDKFAASPEQYLIDMPQAEAVSCKKACC